MKVKPKYDFNFVDYDELNGPSTIIFDKDIPCEIIHQFENEKWGYKDHTVFVIINENGETMSISKESCEVIE